MIIDAQLHEPGPYLNWPDSDPEAQYKVMTEVALAWMDSVGTDRAILHPGDPAWGNFVVASVPDRFVTVPMFPPVEDHGRPFEEVLAEYRQDNPTIKGVRLIIGFPATGENAAKVDSGEFDKLLEVCEAEGMPVFTFATRYLEKVRTLAERYPGVNFIVDHYGLPQPPMDDPDSPRFKRLDELLSLAELPNVAVKASGAAALSEGGYPFADVWPSLDRIIEAFGADRMMWASDQSRFLGKIGFHADLPAEAKQYVGKHTLAESIGLFRDATHLTDEQKAQILGGTAERLLNWPS